LAINRLLLFCGKKQNLLLLSIFFLEVYGVFLGKKNFSPNKMLKLTVNQDVHFEAESQNGTIFLNGHEQKPDMIVLDTHRFHLIDQHTTYQASILQADLAEKVIKIEVNGKMYHIKAEDRMDLLLQKMGIASAGTNKINQLNAPMPGLILKIIVQVGQQVQKGDTLLILEAMKMENTIKAQGTGTIKEIKINTGQTVEKGQLLIVFD